VFQPINHFERPKQQKYTKISKTAICLVHNISIETRSRKSQNRLARHSDFKEMFKLAKYLVIFAMSLHCAKNNFTVSSRPT